MKRSPSQRPLGLSPQQVMVLALATVLGLGVFGLAAFLILSGKPSSPAVQAVPTLTPWVERANSPTSMTGNGQPLPQLSERCAVKTGALNNAPGYDQGKVTRIIDARTIEVEVNGKLLRVGYAGIEVPPAEAQGQPNAQTAEQMTLQKEHELLDAQMVVLVKDVLDQDETGRSLRYVFVKGQLINLELVREGLAGVQPGGPNQACAVILQQGEQQARAASLGWWSPRRVPTATFIPLVTLDTSKAPCDCSIRYVCSDFHTHAEAQACFNACNDYSSKLDDNHDGIACENLP